MKVWISIDMEGISGIVDRDQLLPDGRRYERGREAMMGDLAAVLGALKQEPDVDSICVNDSHDGMLNILAASMPDGVRLISGGAKLWSMNQGAKDADVAFYVGYHARAGTSGAIMDHTYSGEIFAVTLNGQEVGETGINAALAGYWNVPVALLTGDDKVAQEARDLLPEIETVVVKSGISRRAAELLPRAEVDRRLEAGVHQALENYRAGLVKPWRVANPVKLTVTVMTPEMADAAMHCPGAQRLDGRTVGFEEPNMEEAFRAFYSVMAMSDRPLY
ncbi:MAG: peptidase M55 [Sulfobacillus acidophilus]|uniref:Peptidase M55 n=1 Tax=Sulfobacillus acidophilus TaxID=53633 RepID=A0A2T2WG15_9FIRM|nr:MAG: peptidase M55 [Sulfobacillus acidophilus]